MRAPKARPPIFVVMRVYYVYVMASRSRVLYTGVTNDLARRGTSTKGARAARDLLLLGNRAHGAVFSGPVAADGRP